MNAKIQVGIRLRPFLESEIHKGYLNSKVIADAQKGLISMKSSHGNNSHRVFEFDQIFDQNSKQSQVYESCCISQLVGRILDGFHSTIFAYGQTGSGKTFTMEGKHEGGSYTDPESKGIAVRALEDLFDQIATLKAQTNKEFNITCSFLQIYNERIYDLLGAAPTMSSAALLSGAPENSQSPSQLPPGLRLRWSSRDQFQVENLSIFTIKSSKEAQQYFLQGVKNRVTASHKLNMTSSRSHTIFTVTVHTYSAEGAHETSAKLQLVDLAGSERIQQTGTEGKMAKESIDINKSLFTLRQVITALSEINQGAGGAHVSSNGFSINTNSASPSKQPSPASQDGTIWQDRQNFNQNLKLQHIPYRESKLTSLLKQSIGGNCYCLMIACIVPNDGFIDENISTLHYASRATYIKNKPIKNEDPNKQLLTEVRNDYKLLKEEFEKANSHIAFLTAALEKSEKTCAMLKAQISAYQGPPNLSPNPILREQQQDVFKVQQEIQLQQKQILEEKFSITLNEKGDSPKNYPYLNAQQQFQQATDYDNFSDRLIESITLVRQLLESNKELRQQTDETKSKLRQLQMELSDLSRENQELREQLSQYGKFGIIKQPSFTNSISNSVQRPLKSQDITLNHAFHKEATASEEDEDERNQRLRIANMPSEEDMSSDNSRRTFRKRVEESEDNQHDNKIQRKKMNALQHNQSSSNDTDQDDKMDMRRQQKLLDNKQKQQDNHLKIQKRNQQNISHSQNPPSHHQNQGQTNKILPHQIASNGLRQRGNSFQNQRQLPSPQQQYSIQEIDGNQHFYTVNYSNAQHCFSDDLLSQFSSDPQNKRSINYTLSDVNSTFPNQQSILASISNNLSSTNPLRNDSAPTNFGRYTFYKQNFHNLEKLHIQQMAKLKQQSINDICIPPINNEINTNNSKRVTNNNFSSVRSNSFTKGSPASATNAAMNQMPTLYKTDLIQNLSQQNNIPQVSLKGKNTSITIGSNDENSSKNRGEKISFKRRQNSFNQ